MLPAPIVDKECFKMGWKYKGKTEDDFDFVNKKYADWEAGRFATMPTPTASLVGKFCRYVGATTTTAPIYTNGCVYKCEENTTTTPTSYKWTLVGEGGAYLPLTGGTMTGTIVVAASESIKAVNDSNGVLFSGGYSAGAYLFLTGKDNMLYDGSFALVASNGTLSTMLNGGYDGSLTWNGRNVLTTANVINNLTTTDDDAPLSATQGKWLKDNKIETAGTGLSKSGTTLNHSNSVTAQTTQNVQAIKYDAYGHITAGAARPIVTAWSATTADTNIPSEKLVKTTMDTYLPLAGGQMAGTIFMTDVYSANNNSNHVVGGGTGWGYGATLRLYGKSSTSNAGDFELRAYDGTNDKRLIGKGDGALTWGGNNVICANGGTMTGQLVLSSSGIKTSHSSGYSTDQYGNFKHLGTGTTDNWQICNNAGSPKIKFYYETGVIKSNDRNLMLSEAGISSAGSIPVADDCVFDMSVNSYIAEKRLFVGKPTISSSVCYGFIEVTQYNDGSFSNGKTYILQEFEQCQNATQGTLKRYRRKGYVTSYLAYTNKSSITWGSWTSV